MLVWQSFGWKVTELVVLICDSESLLPGIRFSSMYEKLNSIPNLKFHFCLHLNFKNLLLPVSNLKHQSLFSTLRSLINLQNVHDFQKLQPYSIIILIIRWSKSINTLELISIHFDSEFPHKWLSLLELLLLLFIWQCRIHI